MNKHLPPTAPKQTWTALSPQPAEVRSLHINPHTCTLSQCSLSASHSPQVSLLGQQVEPSTHLKREQPQYKTLLLTQSPFTYSGNLLQGLMSRDHPPENITQDLSCPVGQRPDLCWQGRDVHLLCRGQGLLQDNTTLCPQAGEDSHCL